MRSRDPWLVRLALGCVPRAWRDMVRDDVTEQGGAGRLATVWRIGQVLGIAASLHMVFTTSALATDVRDAVRSVGRTRAFAVGATLTFALGIGVNLAVFAAVDRMLFRALPYADPDRLVVMGAYPASGLGPYGTIPAAYALQVGRLPAVVGEASALFGADRFRLTESPEGASYRPFVPVSYTMLRTVGVRPILGRDFTRDDARTSAVAVLLSYAVWQHDFGGRADVIGRHLWSEAPGPGADIVGVLRADFFPPQPARPSLDWSGIRVTHTTFESAGPREAFSPPILRLAPGVRLDAAQAQVEAMVAAVQSGPARPPSAPGTVIRLVPLREVLFGPYQTYLLMISAAATLVLLVACTNLASLLLVRARARERRAALQLALGASAGRVIRTAIAEAFLVALAGSALAVVVLALADHALSVWLPPVFTKYAAPVFDRRVLGLAVMLATGSAVLAGSWPGWRASRVDVLTTLQRGRGRLKGNGLPGSGTILAAEVAITLVLVACGLLAARSLVLLLQEDLGFKPDRLWTAMIILPVTPDDGTSLTRYTDVLSVLRSMPGVEAAAGADTLPINGAMNMAMWQGEDRGERWAVTDQFVETMGMRLLAGRTMSPSEIQAHAPVGLLSESAVGLVWPGVRPQAAVGQYLRFPGEGPREVVGVVADIRGTYVESPQPSLYVPVSPARFGAFDYAVRLTPTGSLSVADVTARLKGLGLPTVSVGLDPATDRLGASVVNDRFRAELLSGFGAVALLLAMVGLYAVQALNASARTAELGVRLSLGATPRQLAQMLVRQALPPVLVGVGLGLVATYWVGQFLQTLLRRGDARDPWAYAVIALAVVLATIAATIGPARRAARTDPAVVLRAD